MQLNDKFNLTENIVKMIFIRYCTETIEYDVGSERERNIYAH